MENQNCGSILLEINKNLEKLLCISLKSQSECVKNANTDILWSIKKMLEWQGNDIASALWYDEETDTILVEEELLMSMIQLANIGQESKRIKLISRNEMFNIKTGYEYKK